MERGRWEVDLPGFRFHPTEEELLDFYLRRVVHGKKLHFDIIGTLNLYLYDPWQLPGLAKIGEKEWYFFVPRDRRQAGRPNRMTKHGFWKATGSDRSIRSAVDPRRLIGLKKTLVFYQGRAPRGSKTDWVMNEYRFPDSSSSSSSTASPPQDIVLCKVYRKATTMKELEQRAAMAEDITRSSATSMADTPSSSDLGKIRNRSTPSENSQETKEVTKVIVPKEVEVISSTSSIRSVNLPELQVPTYNLDWMHDPFLAQPRSPWLENWSPFADILLNFWV